jgi:urea transport system permease protein
VGAAAGAFLVNYAKTFFTGALPEVWLYALGALFVLVTLFLPRGLMGLIARPWRSRRVREAPPASWTHQPQLGASVVIKAK